VTHTGATTATFVFVLQRGAMVTRTVLTTATNQQAAAVVSTALTFCTPAIHTRNTACNVDSHVSEIEGIEALAQTNKLALNRKKTRGIVFRDSRKKRLVSPPPPMADIERVATLKILGVVITNTSSTSEHVCEVIKSCAQTIRSEDSPRSWLE